MTPEEIRALRTHLRCNQAEFARLCGVSVETVSRWESESARHLPPNGAAESLFFLLARAPRPLVVQLMRAKGRSRQAENLD